jgi:hypothetical protein
LKFCFKPQVSKNHRSKNFKTPLQPMPSRENYSPENCSPNVEIEAYMQPTSKLRRIRALPLAAVASGQGAACFWPAESYARKQELLGRVAKHQRPSSARNSRQVSAAWPLLLTTAWQRMLGAQGYTNGHWVLDANA